MDKLKGRIEITIICAIIGIMLITQIKSIQNLGGLVTTQRAEQLVLELNQINVENDKLQEKIYQLENDLSNYELQAADNNTYVQKLLKEVNDVKDISGLTDIEGPGLIITLDYKGTDDYNPFEWNSTALLLLVNELNAAGADAISINDERVVNNTAIRFAGSHISINGKKNPYPYVFKVIGDTKTLRSAIVIRDGVKDVLEYNDIHVDIKESQNITINKYNGVLNFKYAKPIEKE
ncbi:MAG: DUF881 domain-containing protein [Eubacteriales bacterium]